MRTYTISQLSREFDITPRAIRFYEDHGILQPARDGRNRVYTARDRTRLKLTLRGKRLGLTLSEIHELVDMYESTKDTVPQLQRFMKVLQAHRETLEQQRKDLEITLEEIHTHEQQCLALLAKAGMSPEPKPAARAAKAAPATPKSKALQEEP